MIESFLNYDQSTLASRRVLCTSAASSYSFYSMLCNLNLVFLSVKEDAERLIELIPGSLNNSTSGFLMADLLTKQVELPICLLLRS